MQDVKSRQRLDRLHSHNLFNAALGVLKTLREKGYETVFAGGCVRDSLLGRAVKDLDLATAAPPEAVEALFPRTLAVGKAFGTIVVVVNGTGFEVTTFRKEGPYLDGRHPASVKFTDMEQDAHRRDFTINALFYDPLEELVHDYVGGIDDLRARRLRTVGTTEERFCEDHLRMLRGIRFVSQLGFTLDPSVVKAMADLRSHLRSVSAERILNEVTRFLSGDYLRAGLKALFLSRLHEEFWPEIAGLDAERLKAFSPFTGWENAFAAIMRLAAGPGGLAADSSLDFAGGAAERRLLHWKASKQCQKRVSEQWRSLDVLLNPRSTRAERARALGIDFLSDVLVLAEGFLRLRGGEGAGGALLERWTKEYLEVAGPGGRLPPPFLSGQDLIQLGVQPGARMGDLLKNLYDAQLEGRLRDRAQAEAHLRSLLLRSPAR